MLKFWFYSNKTKLSDCQHLNNKVLTLILGHGVHGKQVFVAQVGERFYNDLCGRRAISTVQVPFARNSRKRLNIVK